MWIATVRKSHGDAEAKPPFHSTNRSRQPSVDITAEDFNGTATTELLTIPPHYPLPPSTPGTGSFQGRTVAAWRSWRAEPP